MRASVVIACLNGERYLRDTLEANVGQEWDQPWEIVFADNGSKDGSLSTFRDLAERHRNIPMFAVDASQRPGKSHALNRGGSR